MIQVKRIYEKKDSGDGLRILVDRLWPRGLSKEKASVDLWLKDIAPSDSLRKWFGHKEERWGEFEDKYKDELQGKKELLAQVKRLEKQHKTITLLYGAKDKEHNQAIVLQNALSS